MSFRLKFFLSLSLIITLLISSIAGSVASAASGAENGMGLKQPTAAQRQWINENFPVVSKIRLNALAVERINAERGQNGFMALDLQTLEVASIGEETLFIQGEDKTEIVNVASILPSAVDNSASPAFPPVRSQGGIGSCAAWATTYYQLTYETNLARGRTASSGNNSIIFSPKWTYNLINGGEDGGSYFSDCYAVEMKNGAASWAAFPYDSNYRAWPTDGAVWREALNYRAQSFGQIANNDTTALIGDVKAQLANGHILVIATYVSSWVRKTVSNDPSTATDDAYSGQYIASYCANTNSGGHGMTIVGYNDNIWCDLNGNSIVDAGEKGAFKIANSWGTGDWNGGFRWVSYDALYGVSQAPATAIWPTTNRSSSGIFWKGNIFTLTARASYTPSMVASVTLNSAKRGQINLTLGSGGSTSTSPSSTWSSKALNYTGGNYAFNGTTTACDGTFYMDFSDLNTGAQGNQRWFAGVYDRTLTSPTAFKAYNLYAVTGSVDTLVGSGQNLPLSADYSQVYSWVSYIPGGTNIPPTASFSASPTSGNMPLPVSFDASASSDTDGQIVAYSWNFGDGSSGAGATVSHTYTRAGTFTATLTVTDDKGATAGGNRSVTVIDSNIRPVASFSATPSSGNMPLPVSFDASASSDTDGQIVAYGWNFGDGSSGAGATVSHTYSRAGTFTATLTVTDDKGATGASNRSITVIDPNIRPVASFTASPQSGYVPLVVSFNALASTDSDGQIASYRWSFGDGSTGSGAAITHTYSGVGTYAAALTVTDDKGATGTASLIITTQRASTTNSRPTASFTATPISGNIPLPVTFDASASTDRDGQIVAYKWNFGDGSTGVGSTVTHTYTKAKRYTASLTVTDNRGASVKTSKVITAVDNTAITAPSSLTGKALNKTVTLRWRDKSNNESGFYIERGTYYRGQITFTRIATVSANITSFSFVSSTGTSYYRIQAFNQSTGRVSNYTNSTSVSVR